MSTSIPLHELLIDSELDELDRYVQAFEFAHIRQGRANPASFLPPSDHPLHAAVLREIVRVDMEYAWGRGNPKNLSDYQRDFPALNSDRASLREIAFEEFRLRRQAGENPSPDEYLARYGVRLDLVAGKFRSLAPPWLGNPRTRERETPPTLRRPHHLSPTPQPGRPDAAPWLPAIGEDFLGFRLMGELGRGSFGRVYLARQGDLADRPVVLKITADGPDESQTLAQLRHDNIVPIYSRHREGRLQAVCMPYLGTVTLRDLLDDMRAEGALPDSGLGLLNSFGKSSSRKSAHAGVGSATSFAPDSRSLPPAFVQARSTDRASATPPSSPIEAPAQLAPSRSDPPTLRNTRDLLGRLTYVEAVVWMAARLADGLAHAHECGILHHDMKPANILLADDGRPMLLDFNLAEDLKRRAPGAESQEPSSVGGTIPYMAPEHIDAFRKSGTGRAVDARSDLFALGVILYEMLTGRPPFPVRDGRGAAALLAMAKDRQGPPPWLRPFNPAVSPAVESIVRRCLDPMPGLRYQSARELQEDLERQQAHRPLRYAPDPSRRERTAKWFRRHRRLLVAAALALSLGALGSALATGAVALNRQRVRVDRFEAAAALALFRTQAADARDLLQTWTGDRAKRRKGADLARRALAKFHADDPLLASNWWNVPPASRLEPADRAALRDDAGSLLQVIAWAAADEAEVPGIPPEIRLQGRQSALQSNQRAELCFDPPHIPRTLWTQREEILTKLDQAPAARLAAEQAKKTPLVSARDYYLAAFELVRRNEYDRALPLLDKAQVIAPRRYWIIHLMAICEDRLSQPANALAHYEACIAIWPEQPSAWFNHGLLAMREGNHARAAADFDQAAALRPTDPDPIINRALVAIKLKVYDEAVRGLTKAMNMGAPSSRLFLMRAKANQLANHPEDAKQDKARGLSLEPGDEPGYTARGIARLDDQNNREAMADFQQALKLNPSSFTALWNLGYLYSERLGDIKAAIEIFDQLLKIYPDNQLARGNRGLFHARLGHRDAAIDDTEKSLAHAFTPEAVYKAANVYSLTSLIVPSDRAKAFRFLDLALTRGFGHDCLDADPDFDPIRNTPEFSKLKAAPR